MPSLNWLIARAEIKAVLENLSITNPIASTIQRVFESPPAQLSDFPCIMIVGTMKAEPDRSAMLQDRDYIAKIRLFVEDADIDRAYLIIDAFQEAILDAFNSNLQLNGKVTNLHGPSWDFPGFLDAGGREVRGAEGLVRFSMADSPAFAG